MVARSAGFEHLFAPASAEIHAVLTSGPDIVVAVPMLHVRVAVFHALAVNGIVLPVVAIDVDVIDVDRAVDIDVVATPIHSTAPIISARRPAPDGISRAECEAGGQRRTGDIPATYPGAGG